MSAAARIYNPQLITYLRYGMKINSSNRHYLQISRPYLNNCFYKEHFVSKDSNKPSSKSPSRLKLKKFNLVAVNSGIYLLFIIILALPMVSLLYHTVRNKRPSDRYSDGNFHV